MKINPTRTLLLLETICLLVALNGSGQTSQVTPPPRLRMQLSQNQVMPVSPVPIPVVPKKPVPQMPDPLPPDELHPLPPLAPATKVLTGSNRPAQFTNRSTIFTNHPPVFTNQPSRFHKATV